MKKLNIGLKEVQDVYSGPEGVLWELIMGEQIHIGGFEQSMTLAQKAGIKEELKVLDLCCAVGAGLRFLVKNFNVEGYGIDGTVHMIDEAVKRTAAEGLESRIVYKLGDVTALPWESEVFDIVWGEDAWCYVDDKAKLISEAARVLKKGGKIAFSDWIAGSEELTDEESTRVCSFMKFPYMESMSGYEKLLKENGFELFSAEDLNDHFANCIDLYIKMLTMQLTYDALKIIGDDMQLFQAMGGEMMNMLALARAKKFSRGRWIAIKK